jgi:hypothetical protein
MAISYFFLPFASVQNCKTYPTSQGKNKQALKNNNGSAHYMDVKDDKNLIYFIYQPQALISALYYI